MATKVSSTSLAIMKKPSGKDCCTPNNGGTKYRITILKNYKEAAQSDQENGNKLWENEILK